MPKKGNSQTVIGLAWYREEEWDRLKAVAADPNHLEDTWSDWRRVVSKGLEELVAEGHLFERVDVAVDELVAWCKGEGRPVDSKARAAYVAHKLRQTEQERQELPVDEAWIERLEHRLTGRDVAPPDAEFDQAFDKVKEGVAVGLAWYRKDEWPQLLEVSVDADQLEGSWDEWVRHARKKLARMVTQGVPVEKVDVGVDDLVAWCRRQGRPVDASARADFALDKLTQGDRTHRRFRVVRSPESG